MRRDLSAIVLVQGVTVSRLIAAILIAALAHRAGEAVIAALFIFALLTDLLDGFLARKFGVSSDIGHILDLIADKALTAVALLYAASLGIELLPLVIIGVRDLIMLGMRGLRDRDGPLLPTSRWFGAVLLTGVVMTTAALALFTGPQGRAGCVALYWALAAMALINVVWRFASVARRLT